MNTQDRTIQTATWDRFAGALAATIMAIASLFAWSTPAQAQEESPGVILNTPARSGLISRFTPPLPRLPQDPDRDSFQGTRYQDEHDTKFKLRERNSWLNGGMYGRPLCASCTQAVSPYFRGLPGGRIEPECRGCDPVTGRWVGNLMNHYKPVGMYYDRGVYVPIYDFDYFAPGPGPFPWSHFFKRPTGG